MEEKKPTRVQLEKRLNKAVLHIDRTKDTKEIYFDDRNIRIVVNEDYACIGCGSYQLVFSAITPNGISMQYTFLKRFLDVALENESRFMTEKTSGRPFRSYAIFLEKLEEDKGDDYLWVWYTDKWIYNFECQISGIGETAAQSFATYEKFLHNIACNHVFLSEKIEDMTNKQYVEKVIEKMQEYIKDMQENVIFKKLTDKERAEQQMEAMSQDEVEKIVEEQQYGE